MQRNLAAFAALVIVFLVMVSSVALIRPASIEQSSNHSGPTITLPDAPFYVGVTFCGDSVEQAKQLIDHVKNYTNLFVLQSGSMMFNFEAIEEIGDYAVNSGLHIILYCGGAYTTSQLSTIGAARWGSGLLGLYYLDEPGGKVLDNSTQYVGSVWRAADGSVTVPLDTNGTNSGITFYPSGHIQVNKQLLPSREDYPELFNSTMDAGHFENDLIYPYFTSATDYYPNGTIIYSTTNYNPSDGSVTATSKFNYQPDGTVSDSAGKSVIDQGNITQFTPYKELQNLNPLGTLSKTADAYIEGALGEVNSYPNQTYAKLFTSDYALYWFDYKAGYDTVFAQFVGNESRDRHIALCRGAAETLGNDWGAIITWKYNQAPYLESGDELYNDLTLAYSSGAKYGIVFTYPNITAFGTMTDEHFDALQRFWNTIHTSPDSLGRTQSDVAYVVPADYGFGFRNANDTLWGQFPADELSAKIYSDTVALTARYGDRLNILYDGPETASKLDSYSTVYYYNQTVT